MITEQQINSLIEAKLKELNCFVVEVSVKPINKILVLIDSDKGVSIDDCVKVSRAIEFNLNRDVEDFELNVMSAGLTEPFKVLRQYQKNIGNQVEVLTKNSSKIVGKLLSADENGFQIESKSTEKVEGKKKKQTLINIINLKYTEIKSTKLVLLF